MIFALREVNNPTEANSVAKIYFSLPHLKRIAGVLVETITEHEKYFGKIITDIEDRLSPEQLEILKSRLEMLNKGRGESNVDDV